MSDGKLRVKQPCQPLKLGDSINQHQLAPSQSPVQILFNVRYSSMLTINGATLHIACFLGILLIKSGNTPVLQPTSLRA